MVSHTTCLVALVLTAVHACLGQAPMFLPGQPPMGAPAGAAGGMFSNPMMLPLAMSGMDPNKMMYMSMLMNGLGPGGPGMGGMGFLPAFGLYQAFS